jgi:hypothetical protein
MTKYFLGKNGLDYTNEIDAEKYGGGLVGWRETIVKEEKVTYQEYTGNEAPLSPVDNVLPTPAPVVPAPVVPAPEPVKPMAALFNQPVVLKEHIESVKPTVPIRQEVQTNSPLEAEIVATEPVNVVQPTLDPEYDSVWLEHLNDDQLRELGKQNHLLGLRLMKRETMLRKLGVIPKKVK